MILADQIKDAIADQVTLAANGEDPRDAYARIIALVETAPTTIGYTPPRKSKIALFPPCPLPEIPGGRA